MSVLAPVLERASMLSTASWRVILAVSFGAFLTSLDAGAASAALPLIRSSFHVSIAAAQWVLTAELLVTSGLLLVVGRLADHIGARTLYLAGFAIFLLSCTACGTAPTLTTLIAFRAVQGIGSAMLLANSPILLAIHLPAHRGAGFGVKMSCLYAGLVAGPAAAGWVGGHYGWRAIFLMELPAVLCGLILATALIPSSEAPAKKTSFDLASTCAWIFGFASLVWLIAASRFEHPHHTWSAAAIPVFLLSALTVSRRRHPEALFQPSCFLDRSFSAYALSLTIAFAASYMLTTSLLFLLIEGRPENPSTAGIVVALYALARASVAWWSGRRSDTVDARLMTIPGLLVFACSLAALAAMSQRPPLSALCATVALAGLGFGCFVPPNNSMLMGAAPVRFYGFAAGILATARTLGMTIGVSLCTALLASSPATLLARARLAFAVAALLALAAAISSAFAPSEYAMTRGTAPTTSVNAPSHAAVSAFDNSSAVCSGLSRIR